MTIRETPYHVASDSRTKRNGLPTCSARNHQRAKRTTLCAPRNRRMPSVHRSQRAIGRARRWRKISESCCHARANLIDGVEGGRASLGGDTQHREMREWNRKVRAGAPGMKQASDLLVAEPAVDMPPDGDRAALERR